MPLADLTLAPPQVFAIELRAADWAGMVRWYREVLGLKVLLRVIDDQYAQLHAGSVQLAIVGHGDPGMPSGRVTLAFEVADSDTTALRLSAAGWEFERRERNAEGLSEIVTTDPEGNRLRLFEWPRRQ